MSFLKGKKIVILGGTGSLGRAIVRVITQSYSDVKNVLILSRDEIKQLEMMEDFPKDRFPFLDFKLGDVRDEERLNEILENIDFVIHAAAIKHVVMAEKNPDECRKTNIGGTMNVIRACKTNHVERAVLISTDKAVNPIGVYGNSKLEAERLFVEANKSNGWFGIVRLGNIIGARGSVFEVFERQKETGVIKVTHPDATRFCISQVDAANFVLDSLQSESDQIQTPPMETFSVIDLARKIAPDCEIEIIGLRAGDKLHEELDDIYSTEGTT